MPQAHCWMDSKSQFLVSVPQLLCWLCSHIFLPPLLGSVQQEWGQEGGGTRKVLALGSCWHWEGAYPVVASSARACPAGVCLLVKLGVGLPGRLTMPTNTELDEAICRA